MANDKIETPKTLEDALKVIETLSGELATAKSTVATAIKDAEVAAEESAELIGELTEKIAKLEKLAGNAGSAEVKVKVEVSKGKFEEKTFQFSKKLKARHNDKIVTAEDILADAELATEMALTGLLEEVK